MAPIDHTIDYRLRDIDKRLWTRVKERARSEGHPVRWVLLQLLTRYAERTEDKRTS